MKALSLHGAWAHYERQHAGNEARIAELEKQVSHWRRMAEEAQEATRRSEAEKSAVGNELPNLREENQRARNIIAKMEEEMAAARDAASAAMHALEAQLSGMQDKMQQLTADNLLLKQDLAKTIQVRASTHNKLDEARRRLGLTATEAQVFVKDFDEACRSNTQLRKEVAQLQNERSDLQQQCENRSQHCMTLIAENKRLADQIAELRRQTVELDQEGWKLRQQISAAAQRQQHLQHKRDTAAAATKERPQWQSNAVAKPGLEKKGSEKGMKENSKVGSSGSSSSQLVALVAPSRVLLPGGGSLLDLTNAAAGPPHRGAAPRQGPGSQLPSPNPSTTRQAQPLVQRASR